MLSTLANHALFSLAASDPASHVYNHVFMKNDEGYWVWSGNQGNLVLSLIVLVVVGLFVASRITTGPATAGNDRYVTKNKFAHMVEVICWYLREEVCRPLLGDRTNSLMPFLWTIFFFILVNNLLGLVPMLDVQNVIKQAKYVLSDGASGEAAPHSAIIGGTATQNIWVTAVLAIIAMLFFNLAAIKRLGIGGYLHHLTAGAPFPANVLIFVLELASQFVIKPFALALRLFANMTAGHILLATLFSFAGMVVGKGFLLQGPVTLVAVLGGVGIMFLEIFVAFMQAFVFMFLVTVFISLMDHHDHEHDHDHAHSHGHDHKHGHEHAHA
jgi:F-type H+-transporting ATPase subunit a